MSRHLTRPALTVGLLVAVGFPGAALAAGPDTQAAAVPGVQQASTGVASVRVAHLSPDTKAVDVYFTAYSGGTTELMAGQASYGEVGKYQQVPKGVYTVAAKPTGAPANAAPLMRFTLDVKDGEAYTVAAIGRGDKRKGAVLRDDLTPPKPGAARVRLIQAASSASKVDLTTTGNTVIASDAAFGTATGYAEVPAGTWPLTATADNGNLTAQRKVSVAPGSVTSIVVLDSTTGKLALRSVQDAGGTGVMPTGGVDTGGGGTAAPLAPSQGGDAPTVLAALSLTGIAVAAGAGLLLRRRAGASRTAAGR